MTKKKRGISIVVGYVLLITFGVILAGVVYAYLRTYVPTEIQSCPDGASLFVKEYTCVGNELNITLKNNGKFNLSAYSIYGTTNPADRIATLDLSEYYNKTKTGGLRGLGSVYFYGGQTLNNTGGATTAFVHAPKVNPLSTKRNKPIG